MKIDATIFREYDLRGIAEKDFSADFALQLGRTFAAYLQARGVARQVVVGHDNRATSPAYTQALIEGLRKAGADVTFAGEVPTPVFYFANHTLSSPAGIMVTASHNPPEYNGFKLMVNRQSLFGQQIQEVRAMMVAGKASSGSGGLKKIEVIPDYLAAVAKAVRVERAVKAVLDCGNGTAGPVALPALSQTGAQITPLYCDSDNTFPHHLPDPVVPKNMADLAAKVRETGAELGIGIDGDGDRIGLCDEAGNLVWGDRILALLSEEILAGKPGATIVFDVKCSRALEEEIARLGGKPLMWKTGHSLIEDKMHEVDAAAAGELSGHLYFRDRWFGFDDAIYAAARFLQYLSRRKESLSSLLGRLNQYYATPEIRVEVDDEKKFRVVEEFKRKIAGKYRVSDIDGVKVYFDDGWGLVRASNTQPALVLRFEASTEARAAEIQSLFNEILSSIR